MAWTAVSDPGGAKHAFAADGGALYLGGVAQVFKSVDHGDSWSELGAGGLPASSAIQCIGLAPNGDPCIGNTKVSSPAVAANIWYYSAGAWHASTGLPGNINLKVSDLQIAYGNEFYTCLAFTPADVYRSLDNGRTWSLYANNATIRSAADPSQGALWMLMLVHGGRLATGGELGTDGGTGGIFRDPRDGGKWKPIGPFNVDGYSANVKQAFSSLRGKDGIIVVGRRHSSDGKYVHRSLSEGVWSAISTGLTTFQVVVGLCIDAAGAYWESQQSTAPVVGHTYRSTNQGASWATYESGLPAGVYSTGFAADDTYIYMVGSDDIVYRAPAGG